MMSNAEFVFTTPVVADLPPELVTLARRAAGAFAARHCCDAAECLSAALSAAHRAMATYDESKAISLDVYAKILIRHAMLKVSISAQRRNSRNVSWHDCGGTGHDGSSLEYDPADERVHPVGAGVDHDALLRALETLPEPLRAAVVANYFQGESLTAIAMCEGVTVEAIRLRVGRGLKILKEFFKIDCKTT